MGKTDIDEKTIGDELDVVGTEIAVIDGQSIKDKIYEVRGVRVMLDFELAEIYGYETKNFNRQVKNNAERIDILWEALWKRQILTKKP